MEILLGMGIGILVVYALARARSKREERASGDEQHEKFIKGGYK